jgi:ketosteroid isomerase-like protein
MQSLNNSESKISKSPYRGQLAVNFIGVTIILCFVLGCSFSKFEFGKKTTTGGSDCKSDSETTSGSKSSNKKLPLKEAIVGEWEGKMQGNSTTVKFTVDGRVTLGGKPARYKVLDEETIAVADGGDENYNEQTKVKIVGDTLTISSPSGKQIGEFTRVGGNDSSESSSSEESSSDKSSDSNDSGETTKERRFREGFGTAVAQFYRANKIGDTAEMERILADDFTITLNGETISKRELIRGSERDINWVSSQAKDTRFVTKEDDRVIVEYTMNLEFKDKTTTETCQAEFVKSNDWQIRKIMPCTAQNITKK